VLRELGQTRAGWLSGSQFVFSQHCKSCRKLGLSEEKIAGIKAWGVSDQFDRLERAVLAWTDAIVVDRGRADDAVFAVLKENLTDEQILDLTYIIAMYTMHATLSRALRLEYDDRDEPVREIAAPAGSESRDIGADLAGE
jgi:alkylhydroperoxidase family enzyme